MAQHLRAGASHIGQPFDGLKVHFKQRYILRHPKPRLILFTCLAKFALWRTSHSDARRSASPLWPGRSSCHTLLMLRFNGDVLKLTLAPICRSSSTTTPLHRAHPPCFCGLCRCRMSDTLALQIWRRGINRREVRNAGRPRAVAADLRYASIIVSVPPFTT